MTDLLTVPTCATDDADAPCSSGLHEDVGEAEVGRFDVVADARRFVYRLVGTQEVAGRGSDPTGRSVGEAFYGESPEAALACYEYVVRTRRPFCFRDPYTTPDGWREQEDTIYLPLSADGATVNMVLVYTRSASFRPRLDHVSLI